MNIIDDPTDYNDDENDDEDEDNYLYDEMEDDNKIEEKNPEIKAQLPNYYEKIISYVYNAWLVAGAKAIENCCNDDLKKLTSLVLHIAACKKDQLLWDLAISKGIKPLHPVLREASFEKNEICEYHILNLAENDSLNFILKNTNVFIKERIADKYNFLGYLLKTNQNNKAKIIIDHGWDEIGDDYYISNFLAIYCPHSISYWLDNNYLNEADFYKKNTLDIDALDILLQKNEKEAISQLAEKINVFKKNGILPYLINAFLNGNPLHENILKRILDTQNRNESLTKEFLKIINFKQEWKSFFTTGNEYHNAQKKLLNNKREWLEAYREKAKLNQVTTIKKIGIFKKL